MIFLTVGTQFPFDRLVKAIDEAVECGLLNEEVFAQVGESKYQPKNLEVVSSLEKTQYDDCMQKASKVISHAGMGSIIIALEFDRPLLVMPRMKKYKEVVNDHQVAIAKYFEELKHILVAYQAEDIPSKLEELKTFVSKKRQTQVQAVTKRIAKFLDGIKS